MVPASPGAPDIVHLTLGGGDSLIVSAAVGESLLSNLSQWNGSTTILPPMTGLVNDSHDVVNNSTGSPDVGSTNSNGNLPDSGNVSSGDVTNSDEVTLLLLPEIAPGIVFSADEITGLLPGTDPNGPAPALDIASAPEPGSLLLLASGLAITARWMRGRSAGKRQKARIVR